MTREYCRDCSCLVEGTDGEWVCDECENPVEYVSICPETLCKHENCEPQEDVAYEQKV